MGEARRIKDRLSKEARCVYCGNPPTTNEHMPPKIMFVGKHRPQGLEFRACEECNNGTGMADQVAALYARLEAFDEMNDIASSEWKKLCLAIANNAPKLASEITASMSPFYIKDKNGKFVEVYAAKMEGVLTKTYADIFSSKLGMALYREHVGEPLPLNGSVFSSHFFNVGASEEFISAVKEICPIVQTLSAGKFEVSGQFKYFLGTNHESLCVAYSQFRGNFSVFSVATSKPEILREALVSAGATELKPGELFSKMPNSK